MSKEDARIIARGLLHNGINADKLTPKAREEIRAAIATLLGLVTSHHQTQTAEIKGD